MGNKDTSVRPCSSMSGFKKSFYGELRSGKVGQFEDLGFDVYNLCQIILTSQSVSYIPYRKVLQKVHASTWYAKPVRGLQHLFLPKYSYVLMSSFHQLKCAHKNVLIRTEV